MKRILMSVAVLHVAFLSGCLMEAIQTVAEGVNMAYGGQPMSSSGYTGTVQTPSYQPLVRKPDSNKTSGSPRTRTGTTAPDVNRPSTIAVTWETKSGKWGAAGPTQFGSLPESTEKIAIEYVYDEDRYSLHYIGRRGKFKIYRLNQPWSSANKDIRRWLKEKHGVHVSDIP